MLSEPQEFDLNDSLVRRALLAGFVLCVIAIAPGDAPDPERFTLPKELLLHLTAFGTGLFALHTAAALSADSLDELLAGFLVLQALSALTAATNPWLSLRMAGLNFSGATLFWVARSRRNKAFSQRAAFVVLAVSATVSSVTLLQVYLGVPTFSMVFGKPGSVFGNRNQMAHFLALGYPFIVYLHLITQGRLGKTATAVVIFISAIAITLSRSRSAWITVLVEAGCGLTIMLLLMPASENRSLVFRSIRLLPIAAAGILIAAFVPNRLAWSSPHPLTQSLTTLADLRSGSGEVRLLQQSNTLSMVVDHKLLGVGPGNWPVQYPLYASLGDPSYNPRLLQPTNRLPHGAWIGVAAEEGVSGFVVVLAIAFTLLRFGASQVRSDDSETGLEAVVAMSVTAGVGTLGFSESVLSSAATVFLVALSLGTTLERRVAHVSNVGVVRVLTLGIFAVCASQILLYSSRELIANQLANSDTTTKGLAAAAKWDKGDYLSRAELARFWMLAGRCDSSTLYATEAFQLMPTAPAAPLMIAKCSNPK
jgi:putative inorganic carbon (HCO3(-)) transporter